MNGVIGLVTQVLEPPRGRQPVLAIGILARFYKRLQPERECPRQRHQSRCSLESQFQSRLSSAHMESRSLMAAPSGLSLGLLFMFVNIRSTCVVSGLRP